MKICIFPGCSVKSHARKLCHRHYENWRCGSKEFRRTAEEIVESAKEGYQFCTKCNLRKVLKAFPPDKRATLGRGSICRTCMLLYHPPEKRQTRNLKRYSLTVDGYNRLLLQQAGSCAVCGNSETMVDSRTGKVRRLAVDHCHRTDKIRGLLCGNCNNGLGNFKDSPVLLQQAIVYLTKCLKPVSQESGEGH